MDATQRILYFLVLILSVGLALWRGGAPEKLGALVFIAMAAIQALVMHFIPSHFVHVDPDALVADIIGFLGFGYLALEARRFWPLWATALQILSLSAHFARWADIGIHPLVYAVMRGAPTFGASVAILVATALHVHRLNRRGCDPSWQSWSRWAAGFGRFRGRRLKAW